MLSAGMFSALAATMAVRRRGFISGSPPLLAAIAISLIRRVKALPRFASSAPFLCLIVAHFEWPDMGISKAWFDFLFAPKYLKQMWLKTISTTHKYSGPNVCWRAGHPEAKGPTHIKCGWL